MPDDEPQYTHLVVDSSRRLRTTELRTFAEQARRAAKLKGQVSILLTTSEQIKQLNRQYRKKNKATDVLSFPAPPSEVPIPARDRIAGDLAISVEIAADYAAKLGHSLTKELCILILHGMLHLAGYDHETDEGQMAVLEARLRKRFDLPLSLTERAEHPERPRRQVVRRPAKLKSRSARA
jgi:probable rRNA maturation factor